MTRFMALFYGMSKPQRVLFLSATGLLFLALTLFLAKRWDARPSSLFKEDAPRVGSIAPDFELKDVNGKTVRLSNFRGKNPIFLNFWASWCPACRQEAPENERLHRQLGPKGLKFISLSIDQGPSALEDVRKFVEEFKLSFAPLLDSKHEVLDLYGVTAIPTTFLIDRKGKIVAKEVGPKNWTSSERLNRIEGLFN